jgi:hypothetical protein
MSFYGHQIFLYEESETAPMHADLLCLTDSLQVWIFNDGWQLALYQKIGQSRRNISLTFRGYYKLFY